MAKIVVKQGGTSRELSLSQEQFSIGRTPDNDLEVKDSLISRRHSTIRRKGKKYEVQDLGSANGTYVNQDRVKSRVLVDGDVIRVGDTEIVYMDEGPARAARKKSRRSTSKLGGMSEIVEKVDEIAESFSISSKGIDLQTLSGRSTKARERDSKMFFILFQVGKALSTAGSLAEMLGTALRLIFEVIHAERGVFLLKEKDGEPPVQKLMFMRDRGVVEGKELPISSTITSQVIDQKVSIITSDALQDERFNKGLSIVQMNIRSALCVPLWEDKRVYGAIYLDNLAKSYAFTKDDLELLTGIANLIAIRIRQEEVSEQLKREEMARTNLSKYHSPDIVQMIMNHGGEVGLEIVEREVSVCFIDVVSSTRLAENRNPKEVVELLNEFFSMVGRAVFHHKGNLNKFIGDEVLAIFNAPIDLPNHAEAAVRTCHMVLDQLEGFNRAHPGRKFDIRCAVNTGPVVAGHIGTPQRMEYTAIGDTVNVASRLTKFPEVNTVIVGEKTHEAIGGAGFASKDHGLMEIRGREKPLHVYEIPR